jgi:hypothetical protein
MFSTALREHEKATPHRARIATLTNWESEPESGSDRAAKQARISSRKRGEWDWDHRRGSAAPHPRNQERDRYPQTARPRHNRRGQNPRHQQS